jgi:hypothetical protein
MRTSALACVALLAFGAAPVSAQPRTPPKLLAARQDLRECIIRYAGWASAKAEATPDTVADAAASKCEANYVKVVTRRRLMDKAQAKVEVNSMAYQIANRILSR